MANKSIVSNGKLNAIANAIKAKDSSATVPMTLDQMAAAIAAIPSGGEDLLQHRISSDGNYSYENSQVPIIQGASFKYDHNLTHINFPSVTTIYQEAFQDTQGLREDVVFPNVGTVGKSAFQSSNITGFKGPKVTFIAESGLASCSYLTTIDVGSDERTDRITFGTQSFGYGGLQNLIIRNNSVATLLSYVYASNLTGIYVPDALVHDYEQATNWTNYVGLFKGLSELPTT